MAFERIVLLGGKELMRKFNAIGKKGAKAAARKATRQGARLVQQSAKSSAPVGKTRAFKRSIKLKPKTAKDGTVNTFVRSSAKIAPHAAIVEYGTQERVQKKTGRRTGRGPARKTLKKAADRQGGAALQVTMQRLKQELEGTAKRGGS